jgi:hypothetical protein
MCRPGKWGLPHARLRATWLEQDGAAPAMGGAQQVRCGDSFRSESPEWKDGNQPMSAWLVSASPAPESLESCRPESSV